MSSAGPCYNPLVTAAEKGLTEAIKCLLEAGANPNVIDRVRMLSFCHIFLCLAWLCSDVQQLYE